MARRLLLSVIVLIAACRTAGATNRGFLPGDAFFHAMLTQELCRQLEESDSPSLAYVRPQSEAGAFCGYAGYWTLQLPADSRPLIQNLCTLYRHLRQSLPREIQEFQDAGGTVRQSETNGFHLFVYNADFDLQRYDIGLRYNESWSANESAFGPHPAITRLELFVDDKVAFSNDWRDAASVPRLRTICPPISDQERRKALGTGNERVDDAVVVTGPVQIIVATSPKLARYVHRRNSMRFYSVTNDGIKEFTARKSKWVVRDWTDIEP